MRSDTCEIIQSSYALGEDNWYRCTALGCLTGEAEPAPLLPCIVFQTILFKHFDGRWQQVK